MEANIFLGQNGSDRNFFGKCCRELASFPCPCGRPKLYFNQLGPRIREMGTKTPCCTILWREERQRGYQGIRALSQAHGARKPQIQIPRPCNHVRDLDQLEGLWSRLQESTSLGGRLPFIFEKIIIDLSPYAGPGH